VSEVAQEAVPERERPAVGSPKTGVGTRAPAKALVVVVEPDNEQPSSGPCVGVGLVVSVLWPGEERSFDARIVKLVSGPCGRRALVRYLDDGAQGWAMQMTSGSWEDVEDIPLETSTPSGRQSQSGKAQRIAEERMLRTVQPQPMTPRPPNSSSDDRGNDESEHERPAAQSSGDVCGLSARASAVSEVAQEAVPERERPAVGSPKTGLEQCPVGEADIPCVGVAFSSGTAELDDVPQLSLESVIIDLQSCNKRDPRIDDRPSSMVSSVSDSLPAALAASASVSITILTSKHVLLPEGSRAFVECWLPKLKQYFRTPHVRAVGAPVWCQSAAPGNIRNRMPLASQRF